MSENLYSRHLVLPLVDEKEGIYYLDLSSEVIKKFYLGVNDEGAKEYSYSPNKIEIIVRDSLENKVTGFNGEYLCNYIDGSFQRISLSFLEDHWELQLTDAALSEELASITLIFKEDAQVVLKQTITVDYGLSEDMMKLSLNATNLVASMADAKLVFDESGLTINNGAFKIINEEKEVLFFKDDHFVFSGEIQALSGDIGGWIIKEKELVDLAEKVGLSSGQDRKLTSFSNSPIRFWAGKEENNYNFLVTEDGSLLANKVNIKGAIEATEGTIFNDFYIGPKKGAGILFHGEENNSFLSSREYSSGTLGYGWKINSDGSAEFNNVSVRGKISSSVFEYNHISAIGGSLYVAPTIYTTVKSSVIEKKDSKYSVHWNLEASSLTEAFGGLNVKEGDLLLLDGNLLINNSIIHLSEIYVTVGKIEEQEKNTLLVTFEYNGAENLAGSSFEPGTTIVFYGTSTNRNGLFLTAMGTGAPYLEIYSNMGETEAVPAVRLGNLSGVQDSNFSGAAGGAIQGYGLYSSNAYLRGQLILPSAGITNQKEKLINNSPIRIWAGVEETKDITQANFIVTEDGSLYARRGTFEGIVKAINSEFSGNIRAAGILLEENDISNEDSLHDHFYVAYNILEEGKTEFVPSYKNYVLNIDKNGLSIWEGGLQAYSDYATEYAIKESVPFSIYGQLENNEAYPYFSLTDDGIGNSLNARFVASKGHIVYFDQNSEQTNVYNSQSIVFDRGIWFNRQSNQSYGSINDIIAKEKTVFNSAYGDKGLYQENEDLVLAALGQGSILINSGIDSVFINAENRKDINGTASLVIGDKMTIAKTTATQGDKGTINFCDNLIVEAVDNNGATIGFNLIAKR